MAVFPLQLSVRDVEELLVKRGIEASREEVRCWAIKFGTVIPANLRRRLDRLQVGASR